MPIFFWKKPKTAFVLAGGGALGYAHIGALQELGRQGISPDLVIGTSMGSIVAAYFALFGEVDTLIEQIKKQRVTSQLWRDISLSSAGLLAGEKIEKMLRGVFGEKTFKDCKIPLIVNATDINSGEMVVLRTGSIVKALRASIAVPGLITPCVYQNRVLVDGGVTNNLPFNLAPSNYKIIAINVISNKNEKVISAAAITKKKNLLQSIKINVEIMNKATTIYRNRLEEFLLKNHQTVCCIEPDLRGLSFTSFDRYADIIAAGTKAVREQLS